MKLIVDLASADNRVLAAYLKGSRTNPNVPKDIYRDFDIMYVVKETNSFISDTTWMDVFGTIILKQEQNSDFGYGDRFGLRNHFGQLYSWLLLFDDGNRIDIGVETLANMQKSLCHNKLYLPIIDKIGCLPQNIVPSDIDFHIKRPSEKQFSGCCNEFYWSLCDVIKGIARDELSFAMTTYNTRTHCMLEQILSWHIGCLTQFSVSCGKLNKFFKHYLPAETYNRYTQTFPNGTYTSLWETIDNICCLFHDTAISVGNSLNYIYPQEDENGFLRYKQIIRQTFPH